MRSLDAGNIDGFAIGIQTTKPVARNRDPWLDFLRAAAITLVLVHHVTQGWPVSRPWLTAYTSLGANGVDLFFVLSGWLIGGLFWSELRDTKKIRLTRFWTRRWLRTIPPYAGGLALAWFAVWIYRGEPFDAGYLIFVQNYYDIMPFFFVSWSLCVEEHFYLLLPLMFYFLRRRKLLFLCVLSMLPVLFRTAEYPIDSSGFGYASTATHLRADGLLLGFTAAYVNVFYPAYFERLRVWIVLIGFGAVGLWAMDFSDGFELVADPLLIALACLGLLIMLEGRTTGRWFGGQPVAWLARISYSVYLIHALVIHAFVLGMFPRLRVSEWTALAVEIGLILTAGWIFHIVFERFAFRVREKVAPARIVMSE